MKSQDDIFSELDTLLAPVQAVVDKKFKRPKYPVGLIVGLPRSGSTVFLQFLASTGAFTYPTNLLTRFAYAPYIGALVQKLLFDPKYDPQGQFADIQSGLNFESDLGKSSGAMASNEFFHFWRKYIKKNFPEPISSTELKTVSFQAISAGLASIESALGKPFCTKGMLLQYNIPEFYKKMSFLFFFRIRRDPLYVMQSLLFAREKFYGDRNVWYSAKPKEYEWLRERDIYSQIAGQVYFTEKAIERGLKEIPQANQLVIEYEAFCENPRGIYDEIRERYAALGCPLDTTYQGPKSFNTQNMTRASETEINKLLSSYSAIEQAD